MNINQFRTILDSSPDMIGYWNADLLNVEANAAYTTFFGQSPDAIRGKHMKDLLGAEIFELNSVYIKGVLNGEKQIFERKIPNRSGIGFKHTLAKYLPDLVEGKVVGFLAVVTDVSDIKEREEQFDLVIENLIEGLVIQDSDAKIIHFNKQALAILGLTSDQILGRTSLDPRWKAIKEDGTDFPGESHPAMVTIKTGLPCKYVTMGIQTPDAEVRWLSICATPFNRSFGGKQASVMVTFTDITAQVLQRLQISKIIENSPGMIYQFCLTHDGKMHFPFVSQMAFEIYEVSMDEFIKKPNLMVEMVHPQEQEGLMAAIQTSAANLSPFEWKGRIIAKSGLIKWIAAKSIPNKDSAGNIIWDGLILEITKEIELQAELNIERSKAVQNAKLASLGEMSAGIAHEINNPLAVIHGSIDLLVKFKDSPEKFSAKIDALKKSTQRIIRIVQSLKKFAHSSLKVAHSKHELFELVNEALILVEAKLKVNNVEVIVFENSGAIINCDEVEIVQVLVNLFNNSIDAIKNREEKWLKISCLVNDSWVVLTVTDSGDGIAEVNRAKLFDPFFTTKKVGEGTGLGLSISKGIMDEHKATIVLKTECLNTCFELKFPKIEVIAGAN